MISHLDNHCFAHGTEHDRGKLDHVSVLYFPSIPSGLNPLALPSREEGLELTKDGIDGVIWHQASVARVYNGESAARIFWAVDEVDRFALSWSWGENKFF